MTCLPRGGRLAAVLWSALAAWTLLPGCRSEPEYRPGPPHASAHIEARGGSRLSGVASFEQLPEGVRVVVEVIGAPPGLHGLHVHEFGDCSAADTRSSGQDFNPDSRSHGRPLSDSCHAGDLGNLRVSPQGQGHFELVSPLLTVAPGPRSVVGRSIVVHQFEDDFSTPPGGNAGGGIGCGEILRD